MRRKPILVLCLLMFLIMLPGMAWALTAVAKIGDTSYPSLRDAVADAQTGDTITLVADDRVSFANGGEIEITKSLSITGTVDSSGKPKYTIYGKSDSNEVYHDIFIGTAGIDVTISNVNLANFSNAVNTNTGKVMLWIGTGCTGTITIDNVHLSGFNSRGIMLAGGKFNVKNCVIDCSKNTGDARTKGIEIQYAATGTISNCQISNPTASGDWTTAGIEYWGTASVTVSGCEIQGAPYGIATGYFLSKGSAANGTLTVENCTVSAFDAAIATMVGKESEEINQATLIVKSGSYSGQVYVVEYNGGTLQIAGGTFDGVLDCEPVTNTGFTITGGIYDDDPKEFCAEGYAAFDYTGDQTHDFIVLPYAWATYEDKHSGATPATVTGMFPKGVAYSLPSPSKLPDDKEFTAPVGHVFGHWEINGKKYVAGDSYTAQGNFTALAIWIPTEDSELTKVKMDSLTAVPDELKNEYSTVQAIAKELFAKLLANGRAESLEQSKLYDVKLLISQDGGKTWQEATIENFPNEGLEVLLGYPKGTGPNGWVFGVSHMFTQTVPRLGTKAGEVETPPVRKTPNGLLVKLKGLSPVMISWQKEKEAVNPESLPQTGDNNNALVYLFIGVAAIVALAGLTHMRRKV